MFVQSLVVYGRRWVPSTPPMYQKQPVRYALSLTRDGRLLPPIIDLASPEARDGSPLLTPYIGRSSNVQPRLLADNAEYTLGIGKPGSNPKKVQLRHRAFIDLVEQCARETGEASVDSVNQFLQGDRAALPLPKDFNPNAICTFQVEGVYPFDSPRVRAFWERVTDVADSDNRLRCIVCNRPGNISPTHPVKIKGVPGGNPEMILISANEDVFESYGLKNSEIAPTCHSCAQAYGNALNWLLAHDESHLRMKDSVYVFWTLEETEFDPFSLLSAPELRLKQIQALMDAARTGKSVAIDLDDPAAFCATCLGPRKARVVVREWIDTTVGAAQRSLGAYFALQELVGYDGAPGKPLPIQRLAEATVRTGSDPPEQRVTASLLRTAFIGVPLPLDLLAQAVRRVQAEAGTTPKNARYPVGVRRDRALLIKMVLNSQQGGNRMSSCLDLENTDPAYLCGRLLAVIDAVQRRALGQTNASVIDKFYGSASSTPAVVFGPLLRNTKNHLSKMRKEPRNQGAAIALDRKLQEIACPLKEFPVTLTLPDQGMFALGFYHQRADDERARKERTDAAERESEELGTLTED